MTPSCCGNARRSSLRPGYWRSPGTASATSASRSQGPRAIGHRDPSGDRRDTSVSLPRRAPTSSSSDDAPVTVGSIPAAPAVRFAALRSRDYRRYYALGLIAMTADNIEHVISYWVIYQTFHSPTLGGFAVISHWVPFLLFSFHAGALADRFDCRKLIQISQALFMSASIAWGVLFLTGTLQVWHAVV